MNTERNRNRLRILLSDRLMEDHLDLRVYTQGQCADNPAAELSGRFLGRYRLRRSCGTVCCIAGWAFALSPMAGATNGWNYSRARFGRAPDVRSTLRWLGLSVDYSDILYPVWDDESPATVSARLDMAYEGKTMDEIREEYP